MPTRNPNTTRFRSTTYIARKDGCKFEIVSLHEEYWENVVSYTIENVKRGLTPNPDMMCNKMIKFGSFEKNWGHQFDKIATGHYARTKEIDGKTYLATAADHHKDQTYFLGQINYMQVSKLMFPVGDLQKSEVREIAAAQKLPSALRKDSQGICFLGKINYNDFIERYLGTKPGKIIELETGKQVGTHRGYWFHTIGQRKGLGLSGGPWFVIKKDILENIIYVSRGYDPQTQYGNVLNLGAFNFISENPWIGELGDRFENDKSIDLGEIAFKNRHTPEFSTGRLEKIGDVYRIVSDQLVQGIAPGQFGVIYDKEKEICLGSGVII